MHLAEPVAAAQQPLAEVRRAASGVAASRAVHVHHAGADDENVSAALDKPFISGSNPGHNKTASRRNKNHAREQDGRANGKPTGAAHGVFTYGDFTS